MWPLVYKMIDELVALVVAGFLEGTGIPWPGSLVLGAVGMQPVKGWQIPTLLTLAFSLAYTVGALIQYAVGRMLGPVALSWLSPQQRDRIERLIDRWGIWAICWSRGVAIGNYVSIPAGMMRMNLPVFLVGTFVGAVPWAGATMLAGRLIGSRLGWLPQVLKSWTLPVVLVLAVLALGLWLFRLRLRRLSSTR